ncbi:MAG: hypothetical protein QXI16_02650 [Sulfolobaceae archaeon]
MTDNFILAVYTVKQGELVTNGHTFIDGSIKDRDKYLVDYYNKINEAIRLDKKENKLPEDFEEIELDTLSIEYFELKKVEKNV